MNTMELTARVEVLETLCVELVSALVRQFVVSPRVAEELGGRLTGIAAAGDIDAMIAEWVAEDLAEAVFVDEDAAWGGAEIIRIDERAKRRRERFGPTEA